MAKPMTKTQLVAALAEEMGSDKKSAAAALDAVTGIIPKEVSTGDDDRQGAEGQRQRLIPSGPAIGRAAIGRPFFFFGRLRRHASGGDIFEEKKRP